MPFELIQNKKSFSFVQLMALGLATILLVDSIQADFRFAIGDFRLNEPKFGNQKSVIPFGSEAVSPQPLSPLNAIEPDPAPSTVRRWARKTDLPYPLSGAEILETARILEPRALEDERSLEDLTSLIIGVLNSGSLDGSPEAKNTLVERLVDMQIVWEARNIPDRNHWVANRIWESWNEEPPDWVHTFFHRWVRADGGAAARYLIRRRYLEPSFEKLQRHFTQLIIEASRPNANRTLDVLFRARAQVQPNELTKVWLENILIEIAHSNARNHSLVHQKLSGARRFEPWCAPLLDIIEKSPASYPHKPKSNTPGDPRYWHNVRRHTIKTPPTSIEDLHPNQPEPPPRRPTYVPRYNKRPPMEEGPTFTKARLANIDFRADQITDEWQSDEEESEAPPPGTPFEANMIPPDHWLHPHALTIETIMISAIMMTSIYFGPAWLHVRDTFFGQYLGHVGGFYLGRILTSFILPSFHKVFWPDFTWFRFFGLMKPFMRFSSYFSLFTFAVTIRQIVPHGPTFGWLAALVGATFSYINHAEHNYSQEESQSHPASLLTFWLVPVFSVFFALYLNSGLPVSHLHMISSFWGSFFHLGHGQLYHHLSLENIGRIVTTVFSSSGIYYASSKLQSQKNLADTDKFALRFIIIPAFFIVGASGLRSITTMLADSFGLGLFESYFMTIVTTFELARLAYRFRSKSLITRKMLWASLWIDLPILALLGQWWFGIFDHWPWASAVTVAPYPLRTFPRKSS